MKTTILALSLVAALCVGCDDPSAEDEDGNPYTSIANVVNVCVKAANCQGLGSKSGKLTMKYLSPEVAPSRGLTDDGTSAVTISFQIPDDDQFICSEWEADGPACKRVAGVLTGRCTNLLKYRLVYAHYIPNDSTDKESIYTAIDENGKRVPISLEELWQAQKAKTPPRPGLTLPKDKSRNLVLQPTTASAEFDKQSIKLSFDCQNPTPGKESRLAESWNNMLAAESLRRVFKKAKMNPRQHPAGAEQEVAQKEVMIPRDAAEPKRENAAALRVL